MACQILGCLFKIILIINYDSQILRLVQTRGKLLFPYNLQDLTILKLSYTARLGNKKAIAVLRTLQSY